MHSILLFLQSQISHQSKTSLFVEQNRVQMNFTLMVCIIYTQEKAIVIRARKSGRYSGLVVVSLYTAELCQPCTMGTYDVVSDSVHKAGPLC